MPYNGLDAALTSAPTSLRKPSQAVSFQKMPPQVIVPEGLGVSPVPDRELRVAHHEQICLLARLIQTAKLRQARGKQAA